MQIDDQPKGVTCPCGGFTPFTVWVYAHWHERIEFTCPKCGQVSVVWRGESSPCRFTKRSKW